MIHKAPKFSVKLRLIVAKRDDKHPYIHKRYWSFVWLGLVFLLKIK